MNVQLTTIGKEFQSIYNGSPWYGENMITILDKVNAAKAYNNRLAEKHSITELLLHIINWRLFTISRLERDQKFENIDWQQIEKAEEELWNKAVIQLAETQQKLLSLLDESDDEILEKIVSERAYNFCFLLNGTIQHDIYHTGQISYCL